MPQPEQGQDSTVTGIEERTGFRAHDSRLDGVAGPKVCNKSPFPPTVCRAVESGRKRCGVESFHWWQPWFR